MAIVDLEYHPFAFVTIGELAEYWRLTRRHVLDHIAAGNVEAIQLGHGIYRIRTATAIAFEQRALDASSWRPLPFMKPASPGTATLPREPRMMRAAAPDDHRDEPDPECSCGSEV